MKFSSSFLALLSLFTLFSCVLAGSDSSAGTGSLVFSTTTSGTVVQTFVLKTTVITSCPCSTAVPTITATTATTTTTGGSTQSPTLQVQETSMGNSVRPRLLVVAGGIGVLSSVLFIFA